jgi:hypothetical protein
MLNIKKKSNKLFKTYGIFGHSNECLNRINFVLYGIRSKKRSMAIGDVTTSRSYSQIGEYILTKQFIYKHSYFILFNIYYPF